MTIQVGDKFPEGTLKRLGAEGIEDVSTSSLLSGRKVVIFTLPGAFTPGCSKTHLPGFVANAEAIKSKGVDEIVCISVNDPFVMQAWSDAQGAAGKVTLLADGNGEVAKSLGLDRDLSVAGMGTRIARASMTVEDGVVKELNVEPGRDIEISSAEHCLSSL